MQQGILKAIKGAVYSGWDVVFLLYWMKVDNMIFFTRNNLRKIFVILFGGFTNYVPKIYTRKQSVLGGAHRRTLHPNPFTHSLSLELGSRRI